MIPTVYMPLMYPGQRKVRLGDEVMCLNAVLELLPDQAGTQQSNDSGLGFQGLSSQDMSGLGFSTEDLADSQPRYTKY